MPWLNAVEGSVVLQPGGKICYHGSERHGKSVLIVTSLLLNVMIICILAQAES